MSVMSALSRFGDMPGPMKIGLSVATCGSIAGLAFLLPAGYWPFVIAALAIIAVLVVLYRFVVKMIEKRKANPFTKRVLGNAAAAPAGVSDASRRAMLDDLRKTFEAGIEKFRAAGKNLYSMPWYLLVGEPGSGKTEAIRRSQVGFPPGLQDPLQGAGGTINMNWWFTNHAVILDTAGRLMFEEAPPGQASEWQELLKMLRTTRPNCPVNGMLLVIPADALIQDTADAIERKAGRIAEQFDQIQRALGVRFPVFVVVTKCDRINGFREFFDDIGDPQLQHQILGWSNPAPLDEPFNPDRVIAHLESVRDRMVQRRWVLIEDPVHTEDAQANRLDQVDALFAFPESLMQIAPRLRRYLEMIFVTGPWSSKPLFLRGIYFTSSLREGAALDADLAAALGVSPESLPEGKVWEKERAYFLRDLFLSKVFREKGLVTRATNARAQQRRRRFIALAGACVLVLSFIGLTVLGTRSLATSIDPHKDFWPYVAQIGEQPQGFRRIEIIQRGEGEAAWAYRGEEQVGNVASFGEGAPAEFRAGLTLEGLQQKAWTLATSPLQMPTVFAPMAVVTGGTSDLSVQRREGQHRLFEAGVLSPLLRVVRDSVSATEASAWTAESTEWLATLLRLEARAAGDAPRSEAGGPDIAKALALACGPPAQGDWRTRVAQRDFQKMADAVYREGNPARWAFDVGQPETLAVVDAGIQRFIASRRTPGKSAGQVMVLVSLRDAMKEFQAAEAALAPYKDRPTPATKASYAEYVEQWQEQFGRLSRAARIIEDAVATLGLLPDPGLSGVAQAAYARFRESTSSEFDALLREIEGARPPSQGESRHPLASRYRALAMGRDEVLAGILSDGEQVKADLVAMEESLLRQGAASRRPYLARYEMYQEASTLLVQSGEKPMLWRGLRRELESVNEAVARAIGRVDDLAAAVPTDVMRPTARAAASNAIVASRRGAARTLIEMLIEHVPGTSTEVSEWVATNESAAIAGGEAVVRRMPTIPLCGLHGQPFDPKFSPAVGGALIADFDLVRREMEASGGGPVGVLGAQEAAFAQTVAECRRVVARYAEDYVAYWLRDVRGAMRVRHESVSWLEYVSALGEIRITDVNDQLRTVFETIREALDAVPAEAMGSAGAQWREGVVRDIAALGGPERRYDEALRKNVANWRAMGSDAMAARSGLLGTRGVDFRDRYLGGDARGAPYWGDLFLAGLEILAREHDEMVAQVRRDMLTSGLWRFPLVVTADRESGLSVDAYRRAREQFERIHPLRPLEAPRAQPQLVSEGASVDHPRADELLARMRGSGGAWQGVAPDLPAKLSAIFSAFPIEQPTRCVIVRLDYESQRKPIERVGVRFAPADEGFAYASIDVGERRGDPFSLRGDASRMEIRGLRIAAPLDDAVVIRFRRHQEGSEEVPVRLPSGWHFVRLIHEVGVEFDQGVWRVPIEFTPPGAGGERAYLWIGVKFLDANNVDLPLPRPEQWPRPADWGVAGQR